MASLKDTTIDGKFTLNNRIMNDTGWVRIDPSTYGEGIRDYSTTELLSIRRIGNQVYISGRLSNDTIWADGKHTNMFMIPEGFQPSTNYQPNFVCQGSMGMRYCINVYANRKVQADRYGYGNETSDYGPSINTGTWLNVYCQYCTDVDFPTQYL